MDPLDPLDAQQIVVAYARVLERDLEERRHPARLDSLPFARPVIETAIRTAVTQLASSGQLTETMRDYLQTAYACLADYLDPEIVALMAEYRRSAEQLSTEAASAADRTKTPAWRTLAESSALAAEVARAASRDAERLRSEFHAFLEPA
ncbi:MAG: hypothetical protein IT176_15900 [Acidobacteria bacterium]|nr:hypothetical protein [Acidobacteriota bacterium]